LSGVFKTAKAQEKGITVEKAKNTQRTENLGWGQTLQRMEKEGVEGEIKAWGELNAQHRSRGKGAKKGFGILQKRQGNKKRKKPKEGGC